MRRILGILIAALMLFSVTACNDAAKTTLKTEGGKKISSDAESHETEGWINSVISDPNFSLPQSGSEGGGESSKESSSDTGSEPSASKSPTPSENTGWGESSDNGSSDNSASSNNSSSSVPLGSNSSSSTSLGNNSSSSKPNVSSNPSSSQNTSSGESGGSEYPSGTVWSGNRASGFSGGNGSSSNPYIIRSGEELALLAYNVNSGNSYAGKVFMLGADIDLGGREWTPIGTPAKPFEGVFIGCDKTVRNLSITKLQVYCRESDGVYFTYAGLFGYCKDVEIDSLTLDGVKINISASRYYDYVRVGGLVGIIEMKTEATLRDIRIKNMKTEITLANSHLCHGGAVGFVSTKEGAIFTAERIEADVFLRDKANDYVSYIGGIFGYLSNNGSSMISDFACYATLYWSTADDGDNYGGAFGAINNHKGAVKLTNGFSSLKLKEKNNVESYPKSKAGAILGMYYADKDVKETNIFKNLFGHITFTISSYDPSVALYGSYINPDSLTEINCAGSSTLPENHGFKSSVWNLSDPSHPILR